MLGTRETKVISTMPLAKGDYVLVRKQFQIHLAYCRHLSWFSTAYASYFHVCVCARIYEVHAFGPRNDLWVMKDEKAEKVKIMNMKKVSHQN